MSQVSARVLAQHVSINVKNKTLKEVFSQVSKNSGYHFLYLEEDIRNKKPISLDLKNVSVDKLLERTLSGQSLTYIIRGNRIIIEKVQSLDVTEKEILIQKREISGVVTNENGEPISGASVTVKGEQIGGVTDGAGFYKFQVSPNATLVFSFVGYQGKEVAVGNNTVLNITLDPQVNTIDEIVVTALGIKKEKKALGYAVQEVKGSFLF